MFAAACKALATVSTGKAAAKRAGKALEKVHCHSIFHVHVQQLVHKAQSRGLSLSTDVVLISAAAHECMIHACTGAEGDCSQLPGWDTASNCQRRRSGCHSRSAAPQPCRHPQPGGPGSSLIAPVVTGSMVLPALACSLHLDACTHTCCVAAGSRC